MPSPRVGADEIEQRPGVVQEADAADVVVQVPNAVFVPMIAIDIVSEHVRFVECEAGTQNIFEMRFSVYLFIPHILQIQFKIGKMRVDPVA